MTRIYHWDLDTLYASKDEKLWWEYMWCAKLAEMPPERPCSGPWLCITSWFESHTSPASPSEFSVWKPYQRNLSEAIGSKHVGTLWPVKSGGIRLVDRRAAKGADRDDVMMGIWKVQFTPSRTRWSPWPIIDYRSHAMIS